MSKNIITISREFGSGGREIGKNLAEKLGYDFYDKKLLNLIAQKSGFDTSYIEEATEEISSSFLFNLYTASIHGQGYFNDYIPPQDSLFVVMNSIIKELALKDSCVIVGRCADYILRERTDTVNVFITASEDDRLKRAVESYGIDAKNAKKEIERKNKYRLNYYKQYTGMLWGVAKNYDITLNSSKFGIDGCVEGIANLVLNKK